MTALRTFVADLLAHEGAIIDVVEPDGLDVMAPDALRERYGWSDIVRFGFGSSVAPGTIPIGLENDWLERLGELLGERGRFAERQLAAPQEAVKLNDPERHVETALELSNAVWRLKGVEPDWCRCLLLAFRYTAVSDEKRAGLVWLGFNCTTGAVLDDELVARLREQLAEAADWQPTEPAAVAAAGKPWTVEQICARSKPLLDSAIRTELEPFLAAMRRRLDRDRQRVHGYHDDLRRAAQQKLSVLEQPKPKKADDKAAAALNRERLRIATIEREYAAKLDDLKNNYALTVSVEFVQALVLMAPVQRFSLLIKRRKGERTIAVDWHPTARRLEPPPVDCGGADGRARYVCDDQLHLTAADGQESCRSCGKPYCHACHPDRCPRCRG